MKKLYSFDNFQGDKGIIIADSLDIDGKRGLFNIFPW